jgi:hypothetical protein
VLIVRQGEELAAVFLGALMTVVAEKLEAQDTSTSSRKAWMKDWDLDTPTNPKWSFRHRCFSEVKSRAEDVLQEKQQALRKLRERPMTTSHSAARWHTDLYKELCLPSAERLALILRSLGCEYFVFAFDECSYLGTQKSTTSNRAPACEISLIALRRVIKAGDAYHEHGVTFWYLLLDTDPSILDLAPSGPNAPPSPGNIENEFAPLPLWPYIGFNQMVSETHTEKIQIPADVLKLDHQKAYGRPVSVDTPCASFTYCRSSPVLVGAFRQ